MYSIGEALIGEEPEVAHIDLVIGDKLGPVGSAFANGIANLSAGHTPLLSVIRPNLPVKPSTLIVPKVTVENMGQASKIFGPAQSAVAKAVADSVEENIISREEVEDLIIIASVFIHPKAKDNAKIYRYNYGATKLAIQRAMDMFPDVDKVLYEKDRSIHPMMGFRVTRLWDPPYLQVALDIPDWNKMKRVVEELPKNDHLVLEAGTPLIKRYGVDIIRRIREIKPESFIIADLKTLDTGNLEVRMVADATGDGVVISGLAPMNTIEKAIEEGKKTGTYSIIDMINVSDPVSLIEKLSVKPEVVELHRAIDVESDETSRWESMSKIKNLPEKILVAVAGGIRLDTAPLALTSGADIIIVGRAVTNAKDVEGRARQFLELMKEDIDQHRVMTDF